MKHGVQTLILLVIVFLGLTTFVQAQSPAVPRNEDEKLMIEGSRHKNVRWVRDANGNLVAISNKIPDRNYKKLRPGKTKAEKATRSNIAKPSNSVRLGYLKGVGYLKIKTQKPTSGDIYNLRFQAREDGRDPYAKGNRFFYVLLTSAEESMGSGSAPEGRNVPPGTYKLLVYSEQTWHAQTGVGPGRVVELVEGAYYIHGSNRSSSVVVSANEDGPRIPAKPLLQTTITLRSGVSTTVYFDKKP